VGGGESVDAEDKAEWSSVGRKPLRHWIHASELMAPVAGERATIIRRILFSRHVRPAVKIFPVSAMIERSSSPLPPPLVSFSFLSLRLGPSPRPPHPRVESPLLFRTLTRATRRISDSGVTRYAIRSRSEESINPP